MEAARRLARREQGLSLIEVMIALFVLTVGLLGSVPLFQVAIKNNYRSRTDSTSTALAQMIIDQISAIPVGSPTTTVTITDCASHSITINSAGSTTGAGANLTTTGTLGIIDFTQSFSSVTSGYAMQYTVCGVSNNTQAVYDVRWNVTTAPSGKANLVVVGARSGAGTTNATAALYAPPVTVRTVVERQGD